MLLKAGPDGSLNNMHVGHYLPMALFSTDIIFPDEDGDNRDDESEDGGGKIIVTYRAPIGQPDSKTGNKTLEVPLQPSTAGLEAVQVTMYRSSVDAYKMPAEYSAWFSEHFGFDVVLAYVGEKRRPVLGNLPQPQQPVRPGGWLSSIANSIPYFGNGDRAENDNNLLAFTDLAPYLLVSETSLADVSLRLPEGEEMDVTKFRPNIVLSGAENAFEEDFWDELVIGDLRFTLTSNCGRCQSINVDFDTGVAGTGGSGSVLKKLMKDRRVDKGNKYSPVFGRYGFLGTSSAGGRRGSVDCELNVGDTVEVTRRNEHHTTFGEFPYPTLLRVI